MDLTPYFAVVEATEPESLLSDWRWMIGAGQFAVYRVTAFGNLFLRDGAGAIHFLDISDGRFERVADGVDEFDALLTDRHRRRDLLSSHLARLLRDRGLILEPDQCYGWDVPAFLGGSYEVEEIRITSLAVHSSVLGQLHRQARRRPSGSGDGETA